MPIMAYVLVIHFLIEGVTLSVSLWKRGASEMNLFLYLTRLLLHEHADIQNSRFPERTKTI